MNSRYIFLWLTIISVGFSTSSGRTTFEKTIVSPLRSIRQVETDENKEFGDENKNSFADSFLKNYSDKEISCLAQKKILKSENCYELFKTGPCGNDEWLVLNKSTPKGENLMAICEKKPCPKNNKVWWPDLSMCISKGEAKKIFCNETTKLIQINGFGEGICTCHENFGIIKGDDKCYEYYQQGPCGQDEVVTYDIKTGNAVCSLDKCLKKNQESFNKRSILGSNEMFDSKHGISKKDSKQADRNEKSYAPLSGDGECYKLGSFSICSEYGNQSRFVVDQNLHVPKCSTRHSQLHIIKGGETCIVNGKNECKPSEHINKHSAASYILKHFNQRK